MDAHSMVKVKGNVGALHSPSLYSFPPEFKIALTYCSYHLTTINQSSAKNSPNIAWRPGSTRTNWGKMQTLWSIDSQQN